VTLEPSFFGASLSALPSLTELHIYLQPQTPSGCVTATLLSLPLLRLDGSQLALDPQPQALERKQVELPCLTKLNLGLADASIAAVRTPNLTELGVRRSVSPAALSHLLRASPKLTALGLSELDWLDGDAFCRLAEEHMGNLRKLLVTFCGSLPCGSLADDLPPVLMELDIHGVSHGAGDCRCSELRELLPQRAMRVRPQDDPFHVHTMPQLISAWNPQAPDRYHLA
jgi:hypothetical protein